MVLDITIRSRAAFESLRYYDEPGEALEYVLAGDPNRMPPGIFTATFRLRMEDIVNGLGVEMLPSEPDAQPQIGNGGDGVLPFPDGRLLSLPRPHSAH